MVVIATYEPFFAISDIVASVFTYNINWHTFQELPQVKNMLNSDFDSKNILKNVVIFQWKKFTLENSMTSSML